jgi:hypothetical protein
MIAVQTIGLGAIAATTSPLGALLILSRGLLDGLWMPLLNVLTNRVVASELRATILSLQSFVSRLALAAVIALAGIGAERIGLAQTIGLAAVGSAILGALLLVRAPRLPEHPRVIAEPT